MITIHITPSQIPEGLSREIKLEITNTAGSPCTHLLFDLEFPVPVLLMEGPEHVELPRLDAGESVAYRFALRGKRAGKYNIRVLGFSYRAPDGKFQSIAEQNLPLEIVHQGKSPIADTIRLQFTLQESGLILGEWGNLKGWVTNQGGRVAQGLFVVIEGPFECEPAALPSLSSTAPVAFSISVKPKQSGANVPAELRALSTTGSVLYAGRVQLKVTSRAAATAGAAGTTVIQGSQVEITYGDRTQVSVGGDAVITGSKIGAGGELKGPPKCPGCGKTVDAKARFCENCGARLDA